jgi:hypothetical protein
MKSVYAFIATLMMASFVLAQPAPKPPGGGDGPPPGDRGPHGGGGGGGPRDGPGGPGGPGGRDGRGPRDGGDMDGGGGRFGMGGSSDPRQMKFDLMRSYFDAVDRYARMAHDPGLAGIAAVVSAGDILKPRGADVAIAYFEKTLNDAKIPAIKRAIRLQLVDLYKTAGKQDQALEQLTALMTAEQGSEPVSSTPPPPPPGR